MMLFENLQVKSIHNLGDLWRVNAYINGHLWTTDKPTLEECFKQFSSVIYTKSRTTINHNGKTYALIIDVTDTDRSVEFSMEQQKFVFDEIQELL